MSEKILAEMKWNEIPDATPMYEVLQAAGFPEPMVILKYMNKPSKGGKRPDLSSVLSFLWMTKGEIQEMIEGIYEFVSENKTVRKFLLEHPTQAIKLVKTMKQLQEEPVGVIASRNMNEWRQLFISEDLWDTLMTETPLTLADRVRKLFTETDYLNMPLGEYWTKFHATERLSEVSIKSFADEINAQQEHERKMKEFEAELKAAGLDGFADLMKSMGFPE